MPEGDTIFRAARALQAALSGRLVTRFESVLPALTRVDADRPLRGRTIESVISRGKHILMQFSGDLILHTHLRMNGSWHIYPANEPWRRSARDMRVVIATAPWVAVGFNIPVAEFLTARDVDRHRQLRALGSDLAAGAFDQADVRDRLRALSNVPIADVLLNQRVMSGIGNVLKSEILFVAGVHPFQPSGVLSEASLDAVLDAARRLMMMNVVQGSAAARRMGGRLTTGRLDPAAKLWVYGRGGRPCRRCGTLILSRKTGDDARITFWCPRCQREPAAAGAP